MCDPHLELLKSEFYVSKAERDWDVFVANVERLLGHKLESPNHPEHAHLFLDGAHDAFCDGDTPEMYLGQTNNGGYEGVGR